MNVLVLNSGSSSQKTCLYEIGDVLPEDPPACVWEGTVERGRDSALSRAQGLEQLLAGVLPLHKVDVVGHRIVHGGPNFEEPVLVTPEVKSAIAAASVFAPLH